VNHDPLLISCSLGALSENGLSAGLRANLERQQILEPADALTTALARGAALDAELAQVKAELETERLPPFQKIAKLGNWSELEYRSTLKRPIFAKLLQMLEDHVENFIIISVL
jgi:hypothetical protein